MVWVFYVAEAAHQLLRDPDALVCIDSLDTPLSAGGDERQVLRRGGADHGSHGFL